MTLGVFSLKKRFGGLYEIPNPASVTNVVNDLIIRSSELFLTVAKIFTRFI
jgi:hypothetical protein